MMPQEVLERPSEVLCISYVAYFGTCISKFWNYIFVMRLILIILLNCELLFLDFNDNYYILLLLSINLYIEELEL